MVYECYKYRYYCKNWRACAENSSEAAAKARSSPPMQ